MKKTEKHIVIVTSEFPPQPGGIGNHSYNLALYLSRRDISVKVIADQRSTNGREEDEFDKALPFSVERIKRHNLRLLMYLKRIIVTYKSFKNASTIIATGKFSLWNVAFSNLLYKKQSIAVIHGTEVNFKSFFLRKSINIALSKFDTIVAVSNYTKQLVSHLNLKVEVIANGINTEHWDTSNIKNINIKGKPVLTTVGRVSSRKGQLNVIKHLPELLKIYPELHYHCVGIPLQAEQFLNIAKELNVDSHITFHGSLSDLELKQILNHTDIFVMLSAESKTGDVEGFGIAILEANAIGVPAIGAKGCGIEDAISNNKSGILIDLNNTKEFIKAIKTILDSKIIYQKEAENWAKKHDWTFIIEKYISLLK
ncbi:glycosyltransferase family 4 protein [Psychroserpens sp. Hel_I_66]|uniref:glycosyltransferase family 4 protein n=1 Tax=Psychroserpens sp. Hel_I_66 TaxID=1250004 RepID=UPI00064714C8|nr:glycosyltransferase family 4 protein [Psychroserpens sp. Hel_I_66]